MQLDGQPTAAQTLLFCDPFASELKIIYAALGLAAPSETGTLAVAADLTRTKIMGDGGSNPGLGSPAWQASAAQFLNGHARHCRYDAFFNNELRSLISLLDTQVNNYLPTGWSYLATPTQAHSFDYHLTRLNAISPNAPTTPNTGTYTLTLAAINDPTGTLPNTVAGSAPRIVVTFVGATDYYESLPTGECTQTALTGAQNAYSLQIGSTVPVGITKVRVYRSYFGGITGTYFWDQDVSVTVGSTFPLIKIVENDASLRRDVQPPSWMSCLMVPEFAAIFALSFANSGVATNVQGGSNTSLSFATNAMLSPLNVLRGPANLYIGVGNTTSAALYGSSTITGSGTQTYTAGTVQTVNQPTLNVQGYAGSTNLQARVTTVLNGTCTPTLTYSYLAAATGQTPQSASIAGTAFSGTAVGNLSTFSVPAGRLVTGVTAVSISGTATSGAFVAEGAIRAY